MTDLLAEKHQESKDRMAELKPVVDEYRRLKEAHAALQGVGDPTRPDWSEPSIRESPEHDLGHTR
jgi:hypothetical protein